MKRKIAPALASSTSSSSLSPSPSPSSPSSSSSNSASFLAEEKDNIWKLILKSRSKNSELQAFLQVAAVHYEFDHSIEITQPAVGPPSVGTIQIRDTLKLETSVSNPSHVQKEEVIQEALGALFDNSGESLMSECNDTGSSQPRDDSDEIYQDLSPL
jgi:hypothetical protein